jgi:predicted transcriptional regulator
MSDGRLLALVARYPNPTALARRVRSSGVFSQLRRLEAHGLVTRRGDLYRLTKHGRDEIAMRELIARLLAHAFA